MYPRGLGGGGGGDKLGILDIVTARRPHIQTAFRKGSYDLVVVCNDGTCMCAFSFNMKGLLQCDRQQKHFEND